MELRQKKQQRCTVEEGAEAGDMWDHTALAIFPDAYDGEESAILDAFGRWYPAPSRGALFAHP